VPRKQRVIDVKEKLTGRVNKELSIQKLRKKQLEQQVTDQDNYEI